MPCFTFSDDGKTLVTGGSDKIIRLWDVETGKKKREFVTPAIVTQALISRDGTLVASLGMIEEKTGNTTRTYRSENTIRLWDVASGKELRQLVNPSKAGFHILALAPDGRTVVTVAGDGVLRFWDPGTGKEKRRLDLGKIPPTSLAFSPDGKTLALGGHAIRLIDSATGNDRIKLHGQQSLVSSAAFVLDGRTAVTTSCNQTIALWNARTGEELGSFQGVEEWAGNASFLDRGQFLFANGPDKTIRVYDLAAKKEVRRFKPPPHHSQLQAISPDGRVLAMTGKGKGVTLVNLESVKESRLLQENEVDITGVAFGTLGRTLIVWYADHTAQVWDLPSEKSVKRIELGDKADIGMALAIAGGRFAYFGYSAAVSPDGRYLAYASPKRSLLLYELPAGRLIRRSVELPSDISILAFSPDDRTIAWAGHDSVIHLMETASFRERHQFKGHQGVIYSLAFSPDGRSLISGSEDTTALIWDLTGKLANERSGPLSAVELESCWSDLAGQDAAKAYDTIRRLSIFPAIAGPDLAKRLQPVPVIDVRRLSSLVADLDANQFAVREAAEKQLERLGEVAAPVCRKAMEAKPSTETRRRLAALIEKQSKEEMNLPPNRLRNVRAVEILENIDTREARELLAQLARGAEEAGLTKEANLSLERIVKRSSVAP